MPCDHNCAKNYGLSSIIAGDKLLIYCAGVKPLEVAMKFSFQLAKWYHVAISHSSGGPLSASVVSLYINGDLRSSTHFRYPKVMSES